MELAPGGATRSRRSWLLGRVKVPKSLPLSWLCGSSSPQCPQKAQSYCCCPCASTSPACLQRNEGKAGLFLLLLLFFREVGILPQPQHRTLRMRGAGTRHSFTKPQHWGRHRRSPLSLPCSWDGRSHPGPWPGGHQIPAASCTRSAGSVTARGRG